MSERTPLVVVDATAARIMVVAGDVMHVLERERGASLMHLLSTGRRRAALERSWLASDTAVCQLSSVLGRFRAVIPRHASDAFGELRQLLDGHADLRERVAHRDARLPEVVARYAAMIGLVLTGVDECAPMIVDPALARRFDAHRALMRAAEEAALARAYGMLVLAGLAPGDTPVLSRLLAQEQLHLAEFAAGTLPRVRTVLRDRLQRPTFQRAEHLGRLAAAVGSRRELVTSDEWYATLTAKLRALREVTDFDASALLEDAAAIGARM